MQIRRTENQLFASVNTTSNRPGNNAASVAKLPKKDTAATMSISKSGRERARMLKDDSKRDDYMKSAQNRIDSILDTIRAGGTLSKEDEELINKELSNYASQKYKDYKELRLQPEDVIASLKENYMRRERIFFDMQEKLEAEASESAEAFDTVKLMTYMQEKDNEEKLLEIIREYGIDEDDQVEEEDEATEAKAEEDKELTVNIGEGEAEEVDGQNNTLQKRALKLIERNEDELKEAKESSLKSGREERGYARKLEESHERIQKVLENDEISAEDKIKALADYEEESTELAVNREIQRIKKQFDAETFMMAKIIFQAHNSVNDVVEGNVDRSQIGIDFIKSFLI